MLARLCSYGHEEAVPANTTLFSRGERQVDMFVVLEGEIAVSLPGPNGTSKVITHHRRLDFSGELNLLNSQGSLTEAKTTVESRVLRIARPDLPRFMRSEGEIANHITSSVIWRRIGIIGESMGGIELIGHANDPETLRIQRFLIRNNYPHRIVEVPRNSGESPDQSASLPAVLLADDRVLHRPSIAELADDLGITEMPDVSMIYDVAVVGAGPSGLAAAVYAASEGLCTVVIEGVAPGG
jgi:thioredoxin reductase (NADPH)